VQPKDAKTNCFPDVGAYAMMTKKKKQIGGIPG